MIKLIGMFLDYYRKVTSSISLLPSDDFDKKFSHSAEEINEKIMKKTADQMKSALASYEVK